MPDKYVADFIAGLPHMDDDALLRTLVRFTAAPDQFRPESMAAVREEVARRALTPAQLSDAANRAVEEARASLYDDAVHLALDGRAIVEIEAHLKARGLNDVSAAQMAERAWEMPADQRQRAARRNMITGATLCALGLLLTAGTYYLAATSPEGGRYVIAWGLIVVGFLQFLRGAGQSARRDL